MFIFLRGRLSFIGFINFMIFLLRYRNGSYRLWFFLGVLLRIDLNIVEGIRFWIFFFVRKFYFLKFII